jgi:membrane-bound metal-dependent hydrolase YbcI (DUF457 family)
MSSPIGHILGAAAAYRATDSLLPDSAPRGWRAVVIVGAFAWLPDIDIAFGWMLGDGGIFHRGITHSILFAALLATLGMLAWAWWRRSKHAVSVDTAAGLFVACMVHPLLDIAMGCGPGVPLLAPFFSRGVLSPVQVVPTAYYASDASNIWFVLTYPPQLRSTALELIIFVPLFIASGPGRSWRVRLPLLVLSACGLVLTQLVST